MKAHFVWTFLKHYVHLLLMPHVPCPRTVNHLRKKPGFALVIALALMAFVLLLVLSLTTFVRVETQSSSSQTDYQQAQQAALLSLQVALGELQKHAGADRRITATAELLNTSGANYNPKWTGVWRNSAPASAIPGGTSYQRQFLNWLVSGNEGVVAPAGGTDAEPNFRPERDDLQRNTLRIRPELNAPGVTLVGPGSVQMSTSDTNADQIEDGGGVAAPLVNITFGDGSMRTRYAYWVGDEGIKARVNLRDPLEGAAPNSQDGRRRLAIPMRAAPEIFSQAIDEAVDSALWSNAFPVNSPELDRTISTGNLLNVLQVSPEDGQDWLRARFHDLTFWSHSLLTDTKTGGLKKDLTAAMRLPEGQWNAFKVAIAGGSVSPNLIFPPLGGAVTPSDPGGPNWNVLRSFVRTNNAPGTPLTPRRHTLDTHGFSPIVQQFKLFVGPSIVESFDSVGNRVRTIRLHYMPVVTLWNPYDRPLAATEYYLTFGPLQAQISAHLGFNPTHWAEPGGTGAPDAEFEADLRISPRPGPPQLVFDRAFRFKIDSPEIPPGAAIVFSPPGGGAPLQTSGSPPSSSASFNQLIAGFRDGANYHVDMIGPLSGAITDTDEIYHISLSGRDGLQSDLRLGLDPVGVRETPLAVIHNMVFWRLHAALPAGFQHLSSALWPRVTISNRTGFDAAQFTDGAGNYRTTGATEPIVGYWLEFRMSKGVAGNVEHLPHPWAKAYNPRGPLYGKSLIEFPNALPRGFDRPPSYINDLISNAPSRFYTADNLNGIFTFPGFTPDSLIGERAVLYSVFEGPASFTSIGELMHANLVPDSGTQADNLAFMNIPANYPNYAVGSSIQSPYLDASSSSPYRSVWPSGATNIFYGGNNLVFYDLPYLLNEALWDKFFFSSFDATSAVFHNPRIVPIASRQAAVPEATDVDAVSNSHTIAGAFNINSTSVDAWAAVLGAFLGIEAPGVSVSDVEALLTRVGVPLGNAFNAGQLADDESAWTGVRRLDTNQIRALARAIVGEVKARGPFLSLAHFINRDIDAGGNPAHRQRGVLDAAIAISGVNASLAEDADSSAMQIEESAWMDREFRLRFDNYNRAALTDPITDQIPGAVSQPDLLAKLGSILTPRSDTFTIRFYGDVIDPRGGTPMAQAWGEAIVQRFVDPVEPATNSPTEPSAVTADTFGRQFKVVAFRWLQPEEI
jgi:hypothetical protein